MAANLLIKKEEIYGFKTLYREIGYYIVRLEQYERALKFFDEALAKTPNDKRALIGRSRARAKACHYEGALEDINRALKLDPDDLVVLAHKALNTYLSCEFENGLVQNTRLIPIRKKPDNFTMGAMDCSNAIENCIGERVGRPLRDHFKIIRRLAWKRNYEAQKPFKPKSRHKKKKNLKDKEPVFEGKSKTKKKVNKSSKSNKIEEEYSIRDSLYSDKTEENFIPRYSKFFPYKPMQNYTTNIENYMAGKYLDSMYLDKIFLKQLESEPGMNCPNKEGSDKLRHLAKNGFKMVNYKQELLRTRRPFYFLKYQEASSTGSLKRRQEAELNRRREAAKKGADVLLYKIEEALRQKQLKLLMELSDHLRDYCVSTHIKILPDREFYLEEMYKHVCQGYYDVYRINKDQSPSNQNKRIYFMFGLQVNRGPSTDSVISQFKGVYIDYKKKINSYETRLKNSTSSTEIALLYHELARFHIELKHFELSRVYAKKCITEGYLNNNFKWVVNGLMILTKISVLQHNKNDAKTQLTKTMQVAKKLKDANLEEYLKRSLQAIAKMEFDDVIGFKVLEKREQQIIKLMANSKMKDEASHLFRLMSSMPSSRRMVVIPGVRIEDLENMKSSQNIKRSIIPSSSQALEELDLKALKNKKCSRGKDSKCCSTTRGLGFMELIQYHID